jgi:hypothetical protein
MGILWTVWPLDDQMRTWLDETGVGYPDKPSRFPTGAEIKAALSRLGDLSVNICDKGLNTTWQASIESKESRDTGPWTLLTINNFSGDDLPQEVCFEKGWESLIKRVLGEFAQSCGPLVLLADTGDGEPQIVDH